MVVTVIRKVQEGAVFVFISKGLSCVAYGITLPDFALPPVGAFLTAGSIGRILMIVQRVHESSEILVIHAVKIVKVILRADRKTSHY